jgi:uncharacterized protein (TIGR02147 family)
MDTNQVPNIFNYHDYRAFLKDHTSYKRETAPGFSLRGVSRRAGFTAHNFVGLVIKGQRNLGNTSIRKLSKAIGLTGDESEYFENMVMMNQAISHEEKNHFYRRMSASKKYLEVHQLERDQYEFYSKWHYTVIFEMVGLPGFREDAQWIADRCEPKISAEEAHETIELLVRLKLIERDEDGILSQIEPHLATPPEVGHLSVANFHREMIDRAADAIESVPADQRDISSITMALTPSKFEAAKKKIQSFRRELHALLGAPVEDIEQTIYQINFQLFNLSEVEKTNA